MGSKHRTLSLDMSCSDGRIKKKRLKNLCNPFYQCHNNISRLHNRKRDINHENREKLGLNNKCYNSANSDGINHLKSTLPERTISEQKDQRNEVKMMPCKKFYTFTFTTFMMPLFILSLSYHVRFIEAFNLDIGTRVVFSQPPSTMFGFSVAGHKEGNVGW